MRISIDARHHLASPIDRSTDLPVLRRQEADHTDGRAMREGIVMTCDEHRGGLLKDYAGEEIVAWVGNANLLANPGYVAWHRGELYHLQAEPVFHRSYPALVSWKRGTITSEDVGFAKENGRIAVLRCGAARQDDITGAVDFLTTGVRIVRGRRPVPMRGVAEEEYDTRHMVEPLNITVNGDTLFFPTAQLQRGLLRKAVEAPLHLELACEVAAHVLLPFTLGGWRKLRRLSGGPALEDHRIAQVPPRNGHSPIHRNSSKRLHVRTSVRARQVGPEACSLQTLSR